MRNRLIFIGIIAVLLIGGVWAMLAYKASFQVVRVDADTGASLSIYAGAYAGDGHNQTDLGKQVRTVKAGDSFKLKKGSYTAVLDDPSKQFATTIFPLALGEEPVTLNIHPNYSARKLKVLLPSQQPAITRVLKNKYPQIGKSFALRSGSLYIRGDWYGALLVPRDPHQDVYRVVLGKQSGSWQIVTVPPEIIISKIKYPTIPAEVLSDVDNFKR